MTFGAMAAWQAWLLIALAGALAVRVFLIKLRPPRVAVPSLLLWRRVLDESRELTLWERIRRAVSLVLTVLMALLLTLVLTRPGRVAGTAASAGRVLIVIDSSWSMQARTASGETRWQRAAAEVRRIVAAASGNEVALATTADGLVEGPTRDGSMVEAALERLVPGGDDAGAWPPLAGTAAVHFITDGALPRPLASGAVVHLVYESAPNVAVTALDVRPAVAADHAGDGYVELANYASTPQTVRVTLWRGAATVFDRDVEIGAAELVRQVVPLPRAGDPALRARVSARQNALEADDEAFAWIDGARPLSVAVVGQRTDWLRTAFERDPRVRATFVNPSDYVPGGEDAVIFVGSAPAEPPSRPALLFAPPSASWLRGASDGAPEVRPHWVTPGVHAVVQGVDPFTLSIERARSYDAPTLTPVARSARGTPLVYVSESPERRLVLVTFGAEDSNLAGAPGFPVLLGNALEWLTHPAGSFTDSRPRLASFEPGVASVIGPDGLSVPLSRVNRPVGLLRRPGFYVVEGGGARSTIAINVGNPQVSNLTRAPAAPRDGVRSVEAGAAVQPWWIHCALAAFALAIAEWWTWQRRITV